MALPAASTPVDFAYAVHTQVGHRTTGARVNGRLGAACSPPWRTATRSRLHVQSELAGPSSGTGPPSSSHLGARARSVPGSPRSGAKRRSNRQDRHHQGDAQQNLPIEPCSSTTSWRSWPVRCATRTSRRSMPPWARVTSVPHPWRSDWCRTWAGETGNEEDLARDHAAGCGWPASRAGGPAWRSRASTTSGRSRPAAALPSRATDRRLHHARRRGLGACADPPTWAESKAQPETDGRGSSGPRTARACSWFRSRREALTATAFSRT